jgi:signal transduction histidine kinase
MEPRSRRPASRRPQELAVDTGLALLLTLFLLLATSAQLHGQEGRPLDVPGRLLLAGAGLVLALRRWRPLPVYAFSLALAAGYLAGGHPPGPVVVSPFAALLTVVALSRLRVWLPAAAAGGGGLALVHGLVDGWSLATLLFAVIWTLAAALFGAGLEVHRRYQAEVQAGARWAERSQVEEARRRLAEERLRIAREVHDVVGHSLAVISLQAGVAEHLLEGRREGRAATGAEGAAGQPEVRDAIRAIREVSRQALNDLRAELALLRGEEPERRAPSPHLEAIPELVDAMREAGLEVRLEVTGEVGAVPEVVGAAGYRIVQESLTNVVRHAGSKARAEVRLAVAPGGLEVEVTDDGRGPVGVVAGNGGLGGMRDRARALGGDLEAGARPGGGFRVHARLPWRDR